MLFFFLADLCLSVGFVIRAEDVYRSTSDSVLLNHCSSATQECPLTVTDLSRKNASVFEQVPKGVISLSILTKNGLQREGQMRHFCWLKKEFAGVGCKVQPHSKKYLKSSAGIDPF